MELNIGRHYKITAMKKANTKFGSQIIFGLDNKFSVLFLTRISKALDPNNFPNNFNTCWKLLQKTDLDATLVANTISANFHVCKKNVSYEQNNFSFGILNILEQM